jgi:HlyD family secretion protein
MRPLVLLPLWLVVVGCEATEATVDTARATTGDLQMTVTAVGTLAAQHEVQIGSELSGEVLEVRVESNDDVTAGQVLARLDPTPFEIAVQEADALVAVADATLGRAKVDLDRAQDEGERLERLQARGAATEAELRSARTQVSLAAAQRDIAHAQLRQARASRERAREQLAATEITSPIDGVVLRRAVEPGQTVVSTLSATTLFTVGADLSSLVAEVEIDEADVARVQPGQPVVCTVPAWPDREFQGEVVRVDLAPDPRSQVVVYVGRVRLDNPDGALRSGMTATARVETGRVEDAVLVPAAALRFRPEGDSPRGDRVYVDEGGEPRPLQIEVLGESNGMVAVSGVAEGLAVVTGVRR